MPYKASLPVAAGFSLRLHRRDACATFALKRQLGCTWHLGGDCLLVQVLIPSGVQTDER